MGSKRSSGGILASALRKEGDEDPRESSPAGSPPPPAPVKPKSTNARKGRVEIIEIDSDEEDATSYTVAQGVARGLNPNNVLPTPLTQVTTEVSEDEEESRATEKTRTHGTRASRYGRQDVNYDMKYHPMDEVTRPKRAAARRSGSRSATLSFEDEDQAETTDESELSSAKDTGDEEDETDGESTDPETPVLPQRERDPKASRHSTRSQAQKPVLYSRRYHPQDYALPGFQHKAKYFTLSQLPTPITVSRKRKAKVDSNQVDLQADDEKDAEESDEPERSSPRKKLRSISTNVQTHAKAVAKSKRTRNATGDRENSTELPSMASDEFDNFVKDMIRGSQYPRSENSPEKLKDTTIETRVSEDGVPTLLNATGILSEDSGIANSDEASSLSSPAKQQSPRKKSSFEIYEDPKSGSVEVSSGRVDDQLSRSRQSSQLRAGSPSQDNGPDVDTQSKLAPSAVQKASGNAASTPTFTSTATSATTSHFEEQLAITEARDSAHQRTQMDPPNASSREVDGSSVKLTLEVPVRITTVSSSTTAADSVRTDVVSAQGAHATTSDGIAS